MSSYFTYFPKNATVDSPPEIEGQPINHLYRELQNGDLYTQRGIWTGDQIYSVTVEKGVLFLLGKFIAEERRNDANALVDASEDLDDGLLFWNDYLVVSALTIQREQRPVPLEITRKLRLKKNGQGRCLRFTRSDELDRQALYGIRELTLSSARLLDGLLEPLIHVGTPLDLQSTTDPVELDRRVASLRARGNLPRPAGKTTPRHVRSDTIVYARDPAVKAWVLQQAEGRCELCGHIGPFQLPYGETFLEVHHVQPLADGGPDVVENAVAICPNCHRRLHLSADADEQREVLYGKVARLVR
jgi:hypothetical protein